MLSFMVIRDSAVFFLQSFYNVFYKILDNFNNFPKVTTDTALLFTETSKNQKTFFSYMNQKYKLK